jgi:hypothetical protein
MKKLRILFLLSIFILIFSCEKKENQTDNEEIPGDISAKNNSAVLTGSLMGDNTEDLEVVWKTGDLIIENPSTEFSIDQVYFSRSASYSSYTYWILPVKNISANSHAFVKATGIQYLDDNDNMIYEDVSNYNYVNGSCGESGNITTTTFLKSGETGYFLGIDLVDFDQVKKIRILGIEKSSSEFTYSSINVIPISYVVSDNTLNVTIKNNGSQTVYVSISPFLQLDNLYRPLGWRYLTYDIDYTILEKSLDGNATLMLMNPIYYSNSFNRIRPLLEVDKESSNFKSTIFKCNSIMLDDKLIREIKNNRDTRLRNIEELSK